MIRLFLSVVLVCGLTASASAEKTSCLAIKNGLVLTESGIKMGLTVVIAGDTIREVAKAPQADGCKTLDAKGKIVTPGLVDAFTHLGLVEVTLESGSGNSSYKGRKDPSPIRATFSVADAYNPSSTLIPIARYEGVTSVGVMPTGGIVAGRSAFAELTGLRQKTSIRKTNLGLAVRLGSSGRNRAFALDTLRKLFTETKQYVANAKRWEKVSRGPMKHRTLWKAIAPVLAGTMPLLVNVDRASDIEALLRLKAKFGFKLVILGGAEAWRIAGDVARAKVPVAVDPHLHGPGSFDQLHGRPDNAALLEKAGVKVIISTFSAHNVRKLRQAAGNAVREGLPYRAALDAITRRPATALGIDNVGILKQGARANVVIWSGDPLEISSAPVAIFIGGKSQPLVSRQTLLRDRYRHIPAK